MSFTIDCSTCLRQQSDACDGCVVTFIAGREPDEAIVVDAAEFAALRRLADAGLIPSLQHDDGRGSAADEADSGGAQVLRFRDAG